MKVIDAIISLLGDMLEGLIYVVAIIVVLTSLINPFGICSYLQHCLTNNRQWIAPESYYNVAWGVVSFCWWMWFVCNSLYKAIKKRM